MSLPRLRRSRLWVVLALLATALSGCASTSDPLAGSSEPASCAPSSSRATPAALSAQLVPGLTFDTQTDEVLQVHVATPVLPGLAVLNERLRQDAAHDLSTYRAQVDGDRHGELNVAWSLLGVSTRSVGVLLTEARTSGSATTHDLRAVWYDPVAQRLLATDELLTPTGWSDLGSRMTRDLCVGADQREVVRAAWAEPARTRLSLAFADDGGLLVLVAPNVAGRLPTTVVVGPADSWLTPAGRDARMAASEPQARPAPTPARTLGPPVPPASRPTAPATKKSTTPKVAKKKRAEKPAHRRVDCRRQRCVALTFDDGPGPYTAALIASLHNAKAPATFFMIGEHVSAFPELAHQVAAAGFEIGNHSYTHPDLTRLSKAEMMAQVVRTNSAIRAATGRTPTLLRPPYGARNGAVDHLAARSGLSEVLWDVDTLDWEHRHVKSVQHRALAGVERGSIVLLHDIHPTTVEAVPGLIKKLRAGGYTLVTVSQLIGTPKPGVRYFNAS